MTAITIAIDAMGGDFGPPVTIPAAVQALATHPYLHLILVGNKKIILDTLKSHSFDANRLIVVHTTQQVEMDESPSHALRNKKDSSMRVAINQVKEGKAQACVSAGNTGALMATARFVLKTLPGIDRPAIISAFPTKDPNKKVWMLDSGANVDSNEQDLVSFAVMGSVLASAVDNIESPKVCLLNIGEEDIKGNELVKKTAHLLQKAKTINYVGFIEGDSMFKGNVDVIVTDGFVGNVALKTTEGVATFIYGLIKESFQRNVWTKFVGLFAKMVLKSFAKRIDPASYNGATFIGLRGTVVKSHGGATSKAFYRAIEEAIIGVEKNVPERIQHNVEQLLKISLPPQNE